ncbi:regulatory helix-turn-helix protein, lysR family, partial [Mesorhizobium qingshengii]
AAGLLGRVPSNVTTRIQQLEAEIGVPLFQRDRCCHIDFGLTV